MRNMTYKKLIKEATKLAIKNNKEESAVIILLLHFAKINTASLYQNQDMEVPDDIHLAFKSALDEYLYENVPVQYITGVESFYGYDFLVSEGCLIPRFETEELVENVLLTYDELFGKEKVSVVDIGTGSGCIAITLAKEEKNMSVVATDISKEALEMAIKNAIHLGADVEFLSGDMLEPVKGRKFDILVSNPPYIPQDEEVDPLVKDNEPNVALFGGLDGLKFYRIILSQAKEILNEKNFIAFEHAYDKGQEINDLAKEYFPNAIVRLLKDMQGKDRMTIIINGSGKYEN